VSTRPRNLLIYSIKGDVIELWRVWHESQDPLTR